MNGASDYAPGLSDPSPQGEHRLGPAWLIYFHAAVCCASLAYLGRIYGYAGIAYDDAHLYDAALNVIPFVLVSVLFTFARFSFGYFLGFHFYTVILGFLWLVESSKLGYDKEAASISAFASAVAFLLPTLFILSPILRTDVVSVRTFDRILTAVLVASTALIVVSAFYNFRLVDFAAASRVRSQLNEPTALGYLDPIASNALLPVAFATFVLRRNFWRAALTILLLLAFYPVTLSKTALFAPFWILGITVLSKLFEARTTVVLTLFLPVVTGVVLGFLADQDFVAYVSVRNYIGLVNLRMVAIPSSALDLYNDFFAKHDLTYFCQVNILKRLFSCPYAQPLAVMMQNAYGVGNLNASLFATEGIASVGLAGAPIAVLACGLVVALGNRVSASLPPRYVLMSGAIIPQVFLNVPLTISLMTGGAAVLFLMWLITPRAMFEQPRRE